MNNVGDESLEPGYFEAIYRANPDPWSFATSPYEHAKYEATLAALPRARYADALEIGCSIGVLTARLAKRSTRLLALDVAEEALVQARACCAHLPQVRFERRFLPDEFPSGSFDLILLSEVGYYFSRPDLVRIRELISARLQPGGHLLLVHWTPYVADYPLTGDEVHELFLAPTDDSLRHRGGQRAEQYRLDLFERQESPPR